MDQHFVDTLRPFLKYAGDKQITESSRLRDLGLDSMREIELLFAIEDAYDIVLPEERLVDRTFETSGELWKTVQELLGSSRTSS